MYTSLDSMGKTNLMLDLISQRQRALGSNVANVDTPGYVRRDIDFSSYSKIHFFIRWQREECQI